MIRLIDLADVFGFIQTVLRTEAQKKPFDVIKTTWTEPLKNLGHWVRMRPSDSQLTWVPNASTKDDVIQAIFGKKVSYSIHIRVSFEETHYSHIDSDYLYDVITNRHRLGKLGREGEKWFQKSLSPSSDSSSSVPEHELKRELPQAVQNGVSHSQDIIFAVPVIH